MTSTMTYSAPSSSTCSPTTSIRSLSKYGGEFEDRTVSFVKSSYLNYTETSDDENYGDIIIELPKLKKLVSYGGYILPKEHIFPSTSNDEDEEFGNLEPMMSPEEDIPFPPVKKTLSRFRKPTPMNDSNLTDIEEFGDLVEDDEL